MRNIITPKNINTKLAKGLTDSKLFSMPTPT